MLVMILERAEVTQMRMRMWSLVIWWCFIPVLNCCISPGTTAPWADIAIHCKPAGGNSAFFLGQLRSCRPCFRWSCFRWSWIGGIRGHVTPHIRPGCSTFTVVPEAHASDTSFPCSDIGPADNGDVIIHSPRAGVLPCQCPSACAQRVVARRQQPRFSS